MGLFKTKIRYEYCSPYNGATIAKEGEVHTVYLVSEDKGFLMFIANEWKYIPFHYCVPFEAVDQFDQDLKELLK